MLVTEPRLLSYSAKTIDELNATAIKSLHKQSLVFCTTVVAQFKVEMQ